MSDGSSHFANLTVAAFPQTNFEPGGWDVPSKPNWRRTIWNRRFTCEQMDSRGKRFASFDDNPTSQFVQSGFVRNALNLYEVRARVRVAGLQEHVFECTIVCQEN
jgi:hypothetical protein